jgi:hypothetical protein
MVKAKDNEAEIHLLCSRGFSEDLPTINCDCESVPVLCQDWEYRKHL